MITELAIGASLLWLAVIAMRHWLVLEQLEADGLAPERCTDVTALIPARNEQSHVARCVASVAPQVGRVLVVDDESGDDTAELADRAGAEVVAGSARPQGWSGKLWALQQGLGRVDSPWVLLLDADIEIGERLVTTMRRRASDGGHAFVSLMVELRMRTLAERWLMPAFVYFFRLLYPFRRANDATSAVAAAAGGCILVRRAALEQAGAFGSLRDAVIDDCTLARRVKDAGFNTWIGLTRSARSLRGYAGIGEIGEMVARTAYTQLRYSLALLAVCTLTMIVAFWVPPLSLVTGPDAARLAGLAAMVMMMLSIVPLLRYYGLSSGWAPALPAAATAYLAMTWLSAWRYHRGVRTQWKERIYRRHHDAA